MNGSIKSEIKYCVIQFIKIHGIEREGEPLEPEEYANIIKDLAGLHEETIKLYEGHIDKHEGKIFMATFGVPVAHEEDPERAIKSALLFKKKLAAYNEKNKSSLRMSAGMNLGRVYAGDVGSEIKKEYTVMGDAVNIAARIMERAEPDQILVSEEIHQITKPVFIFSEGFEIQAQGLTEPLRVFEVTGQKSGFVRRRGIEGLKSPLVGRDEELKILKKYLEDVMNNIGNTVIIIGEAGVGKSRLIEELFTYSLSISLERAKVINWCSGYCSPYKEAIYLPFIEIIKQICGIESSDSEKKITEKLLKQINLLAPEDADELYASIANLFNIRLGEKYQEKIEYLKPEELKLRTQVAVTTLLKNYARKASCVYVIDDLYLADSPTLEALEFFLETAADMNALLILLSRPDKEKPFWRIKEKIKKQRKIHEMNLMRLSKEKTKQISENLLKIPKLPGTLLNDIVEKADGNPFFLEEIIKLLIAKKKLLRRGREWIASEQEIDFAIPYNIDAIIRSRCDTLNPQLKNILEEIAVAGRNFSKKVVNFFTEEWETFDELIEEITELGFITTDNGEDYSFNHSLVREVLYTGIPEKRRKSLHRKVAETIESLYKDRLSEFCEVLFEHYSQAGDYEKTIEYGIKAAENARKRYANQEAILFYQAVLEELNKFRDNEDRKREVLNNLGKIHALIGRNEEAFEFFNQALKYCTVRKQEADINAAIADSYQKISDYPRAIEYYNRALEKISDESKIDRAQIQIGIAWVYYLQGDYQKALSLLDELLTEIKDAVDMKARKITARAYNILAAIYSHTGEREESFKYYSKALKLYEIIDDIMGQSVIYNNICGYYSDKGDHFAALDYLEKSLQVAVKTGNLLSQAISIYNIGDTYFQLGDYQKAEEYFERYMAINKQINNRLGNGYGTWGLGMLKLVKEDFTAAKEYFDRAVTIFKELGSRIMELNVELSRARLFHHQREYEKAYTMCEEIINRIKGSEFHGLQIDAALLKAEIRIAQALTNKKLLITYLNDAKEILMKIKERVEKLRGAKETKFQLYFYLSRINYYLGVPDETRNFFTKAMQLREEILQYLKEEDDRRRFLDRRLYREFAEFKKETKM
ncbi:MAG TPA: tetratricopeptide repeat protein [candidate division WOR-3 bacterium]|uniref:Tetratricopeptide repeat protein n=1 Tax=candidate division WOR-3 bacterium TaxID=2052148 RepID=A0A9C9JZS8_UNCW3|nr:tetratricopeptide repeat protein [candidate division WOR-3 bacterium]